MYRILVADDEGIMLEAFKNVIAGAFGEECVVETAKTGRAVTAPMRMNINCMNISIRIAIT